MRSVRSVIFVLLLPMAVAGLMVPIVQAEQLSEFRKPNELETAYIGAAAQLAEPSLCSKISDKALYLGRKPMLARSRCFYYIALNTGELNWCRDVKAIPVELGLINWLEPKRCLFQIQRFRGGRVYKVPFDYAALMRVLGYEEKRVPAEFRKKNPTDWSSFFDYLASQRNPAASKEFYSRLARVPDFSTIERDQDRALFFTPEQEIHEFAWTMGRGMKLCAQGRGSDNCSPEVYEMMRKQLTAMRGGKSPSHLTAQGLDKRKGTDVLGSQKNATGNQAVALRRPTGLERAYYDLALGTRDPVPCGKISPNTLALGWTTEPGLLFMPLRSICMTAVASKKKDPALCDEVKPLLRDDLDGADLTPAHCRRIVAGESPSPHRATLSPDWAASLRALGFRKAEWAEAAAREPGTPLDWAGFAARVMDATSPLHERLRQRLSHAPDFGVDGRIVDDSLFYSEEDLQKHLFQLTMIRFHCSVRGEPITAPKEAPKPPAPMTPAGKFILTDHRGQPVTEQTYRGRFALVYFGFTGCAKACPTSLNAMARALDIVGEPEAKRIEPIFITLDPRNDTVDHLAEYVKLFHPRLQGLTGTTAEVRRAARGYKAFYYAGEVDGTYVVEHTGYTYLIDPEGRHLAYFEPGEDPREIAAVLERYLTLSQNTHGGEEGPS